MYYYLLGLTFTKRAIGYTTTKLCALYNHLGNVISAGVARELARVESRKQATIAAAKQDVIVAARRVVELELAVAATTTRAENAARAQVYKLQTKVN